MNKLRKWLVVAILIGSLMVIANTCRQPEKNAHVNLTAYTDMNGSGDMDKDEPGLPDVLVTTLTNQHGAMFHNSRFTGADGMALFQVSYTHLFYLSVVPPCGYEPVGAVAFHEPPMNLNVGFRPVNPQPGVALATLSLFDDTNANQVRDSGETPLAGVEVVLVPAGDQYDNNAGAAQFTDESGRAVFELGNTCWDFHVRADYTYQIGGENATTTRYTIAVRPGESAFEVGLAPAPASTPLP